MSKSVSFKQEFMTDYTLFFIRTSKFWSCLFLFFFFIFDAKMFLICSYFPNWTLQCHKKEECQTEYNKNMLFHFSPHRQPLRGVLHKIGSATKTNQNQKIPVKEFNFSFKSATLLKLNSTGIFHRFLTQMQLYAL